MAGQLGNGKHWRLTSPEYVVDNDHLALGYTTSLAAGGLSTYAVTGGAPPELFAKANKLQREIGELKKFLSCNPSLGLIREHIDNLQRQLTKVTEVIQRMSKSKYK
jgi:hypothetical protein